MNRRDFDYLTRALKHLHHHAGLTEAQRDTVLRHIANTLETNNANFDKAKFLERCGVKS